MYTHIEKFEKFEKSSIALNRPMSSIFTLYTIGQRNAIDNIVYCVRLSKCGQWTLCTLERLRLKVDNMYYILVSLRYRLNDFYCKLSTYTCSIVAIKGWFCEFCLLFNFFFPMRVTQTLIRLIVCILIMNTHTHKEKTNI